MRFQSNLKAPDLRPHFQDTTIWKPREWSFGHDIPSDKEFEPECGFFSDDEAAILYHCAKRAPSGSWVDIGARFGWSSRHIQAGSGGEVLCVEPYFDEWDILSRFFDNTDFKGSWAQPCTSAQFFNAIHENDEYFKDPELFVGVCIDGDHGSPAPLNDAREALELLDPTGVIVMHDFYGKPIRDGVRYLIKQGMKCRVYWTPNGMAVCWRGDFEPPAHEADPVILAAKYETRREQMPDFDWSRVE